MIHGPLGAQNVNWPCMVKGNCSKSFPKKFRDRTSIDLCGYPLYRRRDSGHYVEKSGVKLDNRSVVPYNHTLLKRYRAHLNVEWCNQDGSIKYLFKCINKGPDRVTCSITDSNKADHVDGQKDEIKQYYDCRYISACEASWRIFSFDIHYRYPSITRLPFHLSDQQTVLYGEEDFIEEVLDNPSLGSSMFLSWMECNRIYPAARTLNYVEFPTKFVWKKDQRCWQPRKSGYSISRIHAMYPSQGEAYFLRILLNIMKGPKSFDDILMVYGHKYSTFREACYALGILDDDEEYIEAIKEACHAGPGYFLRNLFAMLLTSNVMSMPHHVWENTWKILSDGILHKQRIIKGAPELSLDDNQIRSLTLYEIEKILIRNNSTLRNWKSMPYPDDELISSSTNYLIAEELGYDAASVHSKFDNLFASLTKEQRAIFNHIVNVVEEKSSASSGIASLLMTGGRITHSRFIIPLNVTQVSTCDIPPNIAVAAFLKETSLIIWDEAPMVHKHAFEALDRTLRDVFKCQGLTNCHLQFGGKVIVFGGDFRQILPVIPSGTRQDIVNASLVTSHLWDQCKIFTLTKNMRLSSTVDADHAHETRIFAQWLLDLGEGKIGGSNDGEAIVEIPNDLLIMHSDDPTYDLIEFVYQAILQNFNNSMFYQERAILAPTNEVVDEINTILLNKFPGVERGYLSSDSVSQSEDLHSAFDERLYSPDVQNGLKLAGLPNHKLVLKVGVPIMLFRNTDQRNGLCNGTRLQVKALGKRVIEAEVITGNNIGFQTFIARLALTPSDKKIPFKLQRRQFPVAVCFAMTINKSQGQSLARVGLYLKNLVFSHGKLYVALSRVKSKDRLKLLILDENGKPTNVTTNVVFKEIFSAL